MANTLKLNSKIDGKTLEKFSELDEECRKILKKSVEKMSTSMRGITRILRVARTIADLDQSEKIKESHLLEAIGYRRKI
jgi:magnesium chelatase family protein